MPELYGLLIINSPDSLTSHIILCLFYRETDSEVSLHEKYMLKEIKRLSFLVSLSAVPGFAHGCSML